MDFELERELKERIKELEAERDALQQRVAELETRLNGVIAERERHIEINHTLRAQQATTQERITELEAELKLAQKRVDAAVEYSHMGFAELSKAADRGAALLMQEVQLAAAPGAAQWEYSWNWYDDDAQDVMNTKADSGWDPIRFVPIMTSRSRLLVVWKRQRPARQEDSE